MEFQSFSNIETAECSVSKCKLKPSGYEIKNGAGENDQLNFFRVIEKCHFFNFRFAMEQEIYKTRHSVYPHPKK